MKYRFYRLDNSERIYLQQSADGYTGYQHAGIFTEQEWQDWGRWSNGLQREPLPEDEAMRLAGAPKLPGLE